jgi:SAM-dependent methyltransferase
MVEKNKQRLVCVVMGQNCEKFLPMCLESVKEADAIVYCDGGSTDKTFELATEFGKQKGVRIEVIYNEYNQEDKAMNGKQRNFYLNYLKENYADYWALILDVDEVVEDFGKLVSFIQEATPGLYSPKMHHFIGDLGHEDATNPEHFALNRLFKISEAGIYPEVEHPVLQFKKHENDDLYYHGNIPAIVLWHLGYINGVFDINKKYHNHLTKSNMHTPEYLHSWNMAHILGTYPTIKVNPLEIPSIILNNFNIDKDGFYFAGRTLNTNNFLITKDLMCYYNPIDVLDLGCGLGNFGYVFTKFYGIKYKGVDISKFAVDNNVYKLDLVQGDIRNIKIANTYDLVLCLDILEHLEEKDLDGALENIKRLGTNFVFSIPFIGDPNLLNDNTHKIKQSKEWWIEQLQKHFKISEAPENWVFNKQMLRGERK